MELTAPAAQERKQERARGLNGAPVNERAIGRVIYDPSVGSGAFLAQLSTAGGSQALAGQESWWALLDVNTPGVHPTAPPVTIGDAVASGWLGERYYILSDQFTSDSGESLGDRFSGLSTIDLSDVHYATPLIEHVPVSRTSIVNIDPTAVYRTARKSATDARTDALQHIQRQLDSAKSGYAHSSPKDVIAYLAEDVGVGQLAIARALGVTPTAVRKWRRGDTPKPEHRGKLASFAAMCSRLSEMGPHDPGGWLDIPISQQSTLTPLDLVVGGRPDLALLLGSRLADPQETLDAFDAEWRMRFPIDPDYEVLALSDGSRSAVQRRKGKNA